MHYSKAGARFRTLCIIYWFAASWAFVSYYDRNKYSNHVAVSMKFRIGMDRKAENNVLSTKMPFWADTTEWEQGESGNKPLQVQKRQKDAWNKCKIEFITSVVVIQDTGKYLNHKLPLRMRTVRQPVSTAAEWETLPWTGPARLEPVKGKFLMW